MKSLVMNALLGPTTGLVLPNQLVRRTVLYILAFITNSHDMCLISHVEGELAKDGDHASSF